MQKSQKEVKITTDLPPIFSNVVTLFGEKPVRRAVFTYGDKIYNPNQLTLPDEIIEHEKVHMKQQGEKPDLWWGKYLRDEEFRVEQEAAAYAVQYAVKCRTLKGRQDRFNYLKRCAEALSGPLYGYSIGLLQAMELIKKQSGVK